MIIWGNCNVQAAIGRKHLSGTLGTPGILYHFSTLPWMPSYWTAGCSKMGWEDAMIRVNTPSRFWVAVGEESHSD